MNSDFVLDYIVKLCVEIISDQISDYGKEIEIMQNVTKEEYLASLRRYK